MPSNYQQICMDNVRRRGEEFDDIGRLISEQLYSDRSHFVYELLQNAEDALARRARLNPNDNAPRKVQFKLFYNRLEFRHFGAPFNKEDVKGISDVLKGTKKEDVVQIGKFGIGFKSVYAFTASPEIHSGEEHFVIKRYIRPEAKALAFSTAEDETIFNFPFDHKELSEREAFDLILAKLQELGPRVLLFLRWIDEIEWCVEPEGEKGQYLKEDVEIRNCKDARRITVIGQNNGRDEDEKWIVFERYVKVPNPPEGYRDSVPVEIGFLLETNEKDKVERIVKIKDSPLVVFFPTEKMTRLGFLIQGPYKTTPSRDNILPKDDWNKTLVRQTARLLTDALPQLKQLGLLTVSLLEALPIRMDDFPEGSMFHPIAVAVRETLMHEDLLPADDGTFIAALRAKLASAEWLRKLLRQEQLRQLFQTEDPLGWISGEITERAKNDLWKYIREELKVEEITPDSFARKLDLLFFEKQTDEWFIEFFRQLVGQKDLWKKGGTSWRDYPGPLRGKPLIRLQDGRHVKPFRDDNSPNAYLPIGINNDMSLPIVKAVLTGQEEARRFLIELGIPELDIVAEVIEHIIPKYLSPSSLVSSEEHKRDIEKIQYAYKTDSQEKRQRLKKALQDTPFILARNLVSDNTAYQRPDKLYFPDDTLEMYFAGDPDVGFVSSVYQGSVLDMFKDLGVSEDVRVCKRLPDHKGFIKIYDGHGWHQRGLSGFDPEINVAGLENALSSATSDKSAYIWNQIAIPNAVCIRGTIEKSSRQTYEDSIKEESISGFGHLLIENSWLPGPDQVFHKPCDLRLEELPESFERDEKLADLLGMKKDVVAVLAEKVGLLTEDIALIKQHPEEFAKWKDAIAIRNEMPKFPTRTVTNPERRKERITEQLSESPKKEYEERERSVRTTRGAIDPSLWLREQYTNDDGKMVCQICKKEMPFRKRNGEHYFEAVEVFSQDHFPVEHEAQFLALCPLCAAMYKELVKKDEAAMTDLRKALQNMDSLEAPLRLDDIETTIQFVETHLCDVKTILEEMGRSED